MRSVVCDWSWVSRRPCVQSAGIEILEDMAKHQEAAYDRLFKWVQEQCNALTQDAPDFDGMV